MAIDIAENGDLPINKADSIYRESPKAKNKKHSNRATKHEQDVKRKMVTVLCCVNFLSNVSFTLMSPFYPVRAT